MIGFIVLAVFLETRFGLFAVGIRPCENIKFTKL